MKSKTLPIALILIGILIGAVGYFLFMNYFIPNVN